MPVIQWLPTNNLAACFSIFLFFPFYICFPLSMTVTPSLLVRDTTKERLSLGVFADQGQLQSQQDNRLLSCRGQHRTFPVCSISGCCCDPNAMGTRAYDHADSGLSRQARASIPMYRA